MICLVARLTEFPLVGCYIFVGNKSTVSVSVDKTQRYPLFVNRCISVQASRAGLKHLHHDLLRLVQSLKLPLPLERLRFKDIEDLLRLIDVLSNFYF
jgi:hypothetical protein